MYAKDHTCIHFSDKSLLIFTQEHHIQTNHACKYSMDRSIRFPAPIIPNIFQKRVRKKRKFIDPKRDGATKFVLGHRSQRDPLLTDPKAPKRVLMPIMEVADDEDGLSVLEARREEQRNFGVYYDDEYNYLQHLKDRDQVDTELLPVDRMSAVAGPTIRRGPRSTMSNASTSSVSQT